MKKKMMFLAVKDGADEVFKARGWQSADLGYLDPSQLENEGLGGVRMASKLIG